MFEFDSADKPLEDHEYPDDYEPDNDWDDSDFTACPNCHAEIAADSVRCPICGEYLIASTAIWNGKSWWWILLGLMGIAATVVALSLS